MGTVAFTGFALGTALACFSSPDELYRLAEWERSTEQLQEVTKLSFKELTSGYDKASKSHHREIPKKPTQEIILLELARRGGPEAEKWLKEKLEAQGRAHADVQRELQPIREHMERGEKLTPELRGKWRELTSRECALEDNLALVTALRRVQGKPDPLAIGARYGLLTGAFQGISTRNLPTFYVSITNVDAEKTPVWFSFGGGYRSGRLERWRFEVRDAQGNLLPQRKPRGRMGGGLFSRVALEHGQAWSGTISMDDYVRIPGPGEYTARVLYHDDVPIANLEDVRGLVVFRSESFKLTIPNERPEVIELEKGSREKARAAIVRLSETGRIRIVLGRYTSADHKFIPPDSPEGQLLAMRRQAVPELLDTLADETISFQKRGWILALLYSITGERDLDPFDWELGNVLPAYRCESVGCSSSGGGGVKDEFRQRQLAKRWLQFKAHYVAVREAEGK